MTKESVARQFFWDFLENLGDCPSHDDEQTAEEANFILADWFFSGMLEIKWDPKKQNRILHYLGGEKGRSRHS